MRQQDELLRADNDGQILYERYAASTFAYIRLHISSLEDAEDVLIEVFTAALEQQNLSWLAEKQRFVWLRRVAHNKLVDRHRHTVHTSLLPLEQALEAVGSEAMHTPEQIVLQREALQALHRVVSQLSPLQQQILQLRIGDGLRFAEIAILLEKREAAVRKYFSRTLTLLRVAYQQQERGDTQ